MVAFPPFRVDLADERVWKGDKQVALRRKPFAILAYLIANPQRLVTHDELLQNVWGGQVVSESAVRTHLHELRQALGEGVIETVIGRGYRFMAKLVDDAAPPPVVRERVHLAGRTAELELLRGALAKASSGHRALCFVSGDPGMGKTTLVDTFLAELGPDIVALRGACIEQLGAPEAYLAVIAMLGQLRHAPEHVAALVRSAPSFALLAPRLLTEAREAEARSRVRASGEATMAREILDALDAMAMTQPLVIVLEDMQWSDLATIDLVAQLGQRRERAKLLTIVTARREAAQASAHPLNPVMRSLVARAGAISIPLAPIGEPAIADVIAQRFPSNTFPPGFATIVDRITGGTPLFVVALLDDLVARGFLVTRDDQWQLAATLDEIAAHHPSSITQLIDIQLDRLTPAEQRTLEAASVVGPDFGTELLAAALGTPSEEAEDVCDSLARRGLFLRRDGSEEWPDGTLQARYAVTHDLVQQTCAARTTSTRRQRQHRSIAERLERGYRDHEDEVAHVLATHFDAAGVHDRALHYFVLAAERMARRFASADALRLYHSAMTTLQRLPTTTERDAIELRILLGHEPDRGDGRSVLSSFGMASATLRANVKVDPSTAMFERTVELCRRTGDPIRTCAALAYLAARHTMLAQHAAARATCDALDEVMATTQLDAAMLAFVGSPRGVNAFWRGDLERSRSVLAGLLHDEIADTPVRGPSRHTALISYLSAVELLRGDPDRALRYGTRAKEIAELTDDPFMIASALAQLAEIRFLRGDPPAEIAAHASAVLGIPVATAWHPSASLLLGWTRATQGSLDAAAADELIRIYRDRCDRLPMGTSWLAMFLIGALRAGGHRDRAREIADGALAFARTHHELVAEPRLAQLRAELD